ncbi:hypothetical protein IWX49DRAFT_500064 [Phyllosticta citricarpa]|uniref:40S ribosomal protein S12 n=2 Tax=Phyllosticta TaxID=121621 RepID=A0ABR1MBP2_9PEZI
MVSPSPAVTTITPPSSSHGDRSSWDLAVPLDNENPLYDKTYMSHDASARFTGKRQLLSNQPNGYPRYTQLRRNEPVEPYRSNPMPSRVEALGKNPGPNGTTGSESDSLLDLYDGEHRNRTMGSDADDLDLVEQDQSHWIHRDKLAEIERTELEAAGFIPRQSTTTSRSSSRSRPPRRKKEPSSHLDDGLIAEKSPKLSPISPPPGRAEFQENPTSDRSSPVDGADRENGSRIPRPATSKIPIPKSTPATSPTGTGKPRSRSGSANLLTGPPAEALAMHKTRKRGSSVGSQVLLDDVSDPGKSTGSDEDKKTSKTSPTKARTPRNKTPTSAKRAASKPRTASNQKQRANSGSRPRTASRPTTARPEGEAPWIATMYKPDPRLPQDQQMLPTHAKRMAQEQWEKDGKFGDTYDREFRPLNDFDFGPKPPQSPSSLPQEREAFQATSAQPQEQNKMETPKSEKPVEDVNWPLSSPEPTEKIEKSPSRNSPNAEHGGFKLTPSVSPPPPQNGSPAAAPSPRIGSPIRVPEGPEEKPGKKPKKSLCCCTSDGEEQPQVEQQEVEVSADASSGQMSVLDALKGVLKIALIHDGLARGLREASKALDRRQAHMCVLNESCEEEAYKKLVVALCSEHKIPLIKVPDGKQLGEWAGLCQIDREGNARKVVNCSCVVVKDWGEESQERSVLLNYFQTEQ